MFYRAEVEPAVPVHLGVLEHVEDGAEGAVAGGLDLGVEVVDVAELGLVGHLVRVDGGKAARFDF